MTATTASTDPGTISSRPTTTSTTSTSGVATRQMPSSRPSRAVVEAVRPMVDGGRFAAKAAIDEPERVQADVFTDGHDLVAAAVRWRAVGDESWSEQRLVPLGNDRFETTITLDRLGRWEYDVFGWVDHAATWRRDTNKKIAAGIDVTLELHAGADMIAAIIANAAQADPDDLDRLRAVHDDLAAGVTTRLAPDRDSLDRDSLDRDSLDRDSLDDVFFRTAPRGPLAHLETPLQIDVDPLHASFGAWYEFFPRSTVGQDAGSSGSGTSGSATADSTTSSSIGALADAVDRLDYVAAMGFDIVYLPPIHPVGVTKRKGRNNSTTATESDVGSPWAIGGSAGGHTAVDPELGTIADVERLVVACRERGLELALDIAFQCSPDHPWVTEHPEWFAKRADGSIQYAENPPKKYEDIYPLDFESADWRALWEGLADVFRFWIDRGVTIFRVDNPHTKAFPFWEWVIGEIRSEHPETVFLAEAFTRPRVMERLAKVGFNQSYTYFAWRQTAPELSEYFTELGSRTLDYFRPNAWPNTPDILTEQLQTGGRAVFVSRAVLAATLSPSWGVYGPAFELLEHLPVREGSEEYLDSEKYQVRKWDLSRGDSLAPLLTRLNRIRHDQPALRRLDTIHFHGADDPNLLCFSKTDPAGRGDPVLVVVNLDPHGAHSGMVDIDLAPLGLPYGSDYDVVDQLGGATYRWSGNRNYVDLSPWAAMAHVFTVIAADPQRDQQREEATA